MKDMTRETGHSTKLEKTGNKEDVVKRAARERSQAQSARTTDMISSSLHHGTTETTSSEESSTRNYEGVESDIRTKNEKYTEDIENNIPKLTPEYTENNTLKLSIEEYIEKAGKAEKPIILKKTDDWDKALDAFLTKGEGTKALFLDFDGTMARFTPTPKETLAVHGFLPAVKTFLDKGYKVAIITGRPINEDTGVLAALKRSGADEDLINNLDIFGSHGVEHRGPETEGKVQIRGDIQDYIKPQEALLNKLKDLIAKDEVLKEFYIQEGKESKKAGISFEPKAVGATIHYRAVEEEKRQQVQNSLKNLLSKVLPKKSANNNFERLTDQSNEDFKKFMYNSSAMAFEIHLNPGTTGIEAHKGASVKYLVKKWQVQDAIAFGDERTDLDKLDALKELEADNASSLKTQAFVGTKHDKTPKRIVDDATIVVEGQESAVGLLFNMAERAEKQN